MMFSLGCEPGVRLVPAFEYVSSDPVLFVSSRLRDDRKTGDPCGSTIKKFYPTFL
jgi:hypothetical protein